MISLAPGETNLIGSRPLTQAEADGLYFPIDGDLGQADFGLNSNQVQEAINAAIISNQLISIPEADSRYLGIDADFGFLLQEFNTQFQSWLTQQETQIESIGIGLMNETLQEINNHRAETPAHSWEQISNKPVFDALYRKTTVPIEWNDLINIPSLVTSWESVTDKPTEFPPESHWHYWGALSNPPETATRWPLWTEVGDKPATFPPESHAHDWSAIANPPLTATRWPTWGEVTSKPSTFPPESHAHDWNAIANPPLPATRWPSWTEVTSKPSTFPPGAHTHSTLGTLIEEGDWLPLVRGATVPGIYETQRRIGKYLRIGPLVLWNFELIFSPQITGGGSGELRVHGLPFTVESAITYGNCAPSMAYHFGITTTEATASFSPAQNSNHLLLLSYPADGSQVIEPISRIVANGYLRAFGFYWSSN